jgi:beta-glucosidase
MKLLIGAATSAYQIEGNDVNSDWWELEKTERVNEKRRVANSYRFYEQDRQLLQELNANSYRFSVSWPRIEPERGQFDQGVIDHYVKLVDDLLAHEIEPIVTLHHFENPTWFEEEIGWLHKDSPKVFIDFLKHLIPQFKGKVKYFITINEPNIYAGAKYLVGDWFPHHKSPIQFLQCYKNLLVAHQQAYYLIKSEIPESMISVCLHDFSFVPTSKSPVYLVENLVSQVKNYMSTDWFYTNALKQMDFLAVNFYSFRRLSLWPKPKVEPQHYIGLNNDELEQDPKELAEVIIKYSKKYGLPVLISENGTPASDPHRIEYLNQVFDLLDKLKRRDDVKLMGYIYWTLMDSYEWLQSYKIHYGLYTLDRQPKPSTQVFAQRVKSLLA